MNKILLLIFWISIFMNQENNVNGQARADWTEKKAKSWFDEGSFTNGWKVKAHPSVNAQEFAYQYNKNKSLWDKAFDYLKNTNLDTVGPGKYAIDGENVFISVTEGPAKNIEAAKWEAHKKYVDIQYVIKGKETMGAISIDKVTPLDSFDNAKDLGFYTAPEKDAKYYEASPEAFLIFFPIDAHRPGIKVDGSDIVKKVVVKILAD